jgi:hypothetical protein
MRFAPRARRARSSQRTDRNSRFRSRTSARLGSAACSSTTCTARSRSIDARSCSLRLPGKCCCCFVDLVLTCVATATFSRAATRLLSGFSSLCSTFLANAATLPPPPPPPPGTGLGLGLGGALATANDVSLANRTVPRPAASSCCSSSSSSDSAAAAAFLRAEVAALLLACDGFVADETLLFFDAEPFFALSSSLDASSSEDEEDDEDDDDDFSSTPSSSTSASSSSLRSTSSASSSSELAFSSSSSSSFLLLRPPRLELTRIIRDLVERNAAAAPHPDARPFSGSISNDVPAPPARGARTRRTTPDFLRLARVRIRIRIRIRAIFVRLLTLLGAAALAGIERERCGAVRRCICWNGLTKYKKHVCPFTHLFVSYLYLLRLPLLGARPTGFALLGLFFDAERPRAGCCRVSSVRLLKLLFPWDDDER